MRSSTPAVVLLLSIGLARNAALEAQTTVTGCPHSLRRVQVLLADAEALGELGIAEVLVDVTSSSLVFPHHFFDQQTCWIGEPSRVGPAHQGHGHWLDGAGNPAGGATEATGLSISWQNGPLSIDGERQPPNGCFVETLILAAQDRLRFYQGSKFACPENEAAIGKLDVALRILRNRTADRIKRGVEGTHEV